MFARRGELRGTIGIGVLALRLAWAEPALAAEDGASNVAIPEAEAARAMALNEEGAALYAARDYRRAVEKFIQAHAVDEDPNLLFNIASCYEKLGDADAAIEKYRDFLAAPAADPEGRQRAEKAIEALSHGPAEAGPARSKPADAAVKAPREPQAPPTPVVLQVRPDGPRLLPWLAFGGGAVLGVAGATFYLLGANDHAEVTGSPGYGDRSVAASMTLAQAEHLVRNGKTKKWIGGTSLVLGGALVTSYLVIWLLDDGRPVKAETEPRLSVSTDRAGATVAWIGSF